MDDRPRSHLSEILEPLFEGEELARSRVWNRVQSGVAARERRRRRAPWIAGGAAAAVVSLLLLVPVFMSGTADQSNELNLWTVSHDRVALGAVLEMLGAPSGEMSDEQAMEEFVRYLVVTEAQATPQ